MLHTVRSLAALVLGMAILLAGLALARPDESLLPTAMPRDLVWLGADFRR